MSDFKLTKRPNPAIAYGLLQQDSEKEIQAWLIHNMQRFLVNELHVSNSNLAKCEEKITTFCKDIYTEIHDVGYKEGVESAESDFAESF